jgi:hypothetical protein
MGSNRAREPGRDKAKLLIPQAIREGWSAPRLANEAGISHNTAGDLLVETSRKLQTKVDQELGLAVDAMRRLATQERERVTSRLAQVGIFADELLKTAKVELGFVLEAQKDRTENGLVSVATDDEGEDSGTHPDDARIARIEKLAGILAKCGKASESSWQLFRSASGLELAERLTEAKAKANLSSKDSGQVWEADFTLLPSAESSS